MKTHQHPPCQGCRYFQEQEREVGACHRFPPSFAGNGATNNTHQWKFPLVSAHYWCGEYQVATVAQSVLPPVAAASAG